MPRVELMSVVYRATCSRCYSLRLLEIGPAPVGRVEANCAEQQAMERFGWSADHADMWLCDICGAAQVRPEKDR